MPVARSCLDPVLVVLAGNGRTGPLMGGILYHAVGDAPWQRTPIGAPVVMGMLRMERLSMMRGSASGATGSAMTRLADLWKAVDNSWHSWKKAEQEAIERAARVQSEGGNPLLDAQFRRLAAEADRRQQEHLAAADAYADLKNSEGKKPEEWMDEWFRVIRRT